MARSNKKKPTGKDSKHTKDPDPSQDSERTKDSERTEDPDRSQDSERPVYFSSGGSAGSANSANSGNAAGRESALRTQFEGLRGDGDDQDTVGPEGTMKYFEDIGCNLEDASVFVAIETLRAENIGELKKDGFVQGWIAARVDANTAAQKQYMTNRIRQLSANPDVFKAVYKHTFVAGKDTDQRSLDRDNALVYWTSLFNAPGRPWVGKQTGRDFAALWAEFVQEKWNKSISRDLWNQLLLFADRSADDETLGFWSEDGAWPGVIDDFVGWLRARDEANGVAMDVDHPASTS